MKDLESVSRNGSTEGNNKKSGRTKDCRTKN